jgi:hypothetical protein
MKLSIGIYKSWMEVVELAKLDPEFAKNVKKMIFEE